MESLLEWLKTWDWNALLTVIITFLTVNSGSIIALVICLIKSRLKSYNFQEALEKKSQEDRKVQQENQVRFEQTMISILKNMEITIIQNNTAANQERLRILKTALGDADKETEELEELPEDPEATDTNADANEVLNSLGA